MKNDLFSLRGKNILLTGGAGLVGSGFAEALYSYGANVIIGDKDRKNAETLINRTKKKNSKNKMIFKYLDITDIDSVHKCLEAIIEEFQCINVVINNAYPRNKNYGKIYEDIDIDDWRENVDMHLNSYFLVCQVFSKQMMKQGYGKIINIASIYGMRGPRFNIYEGTNMTMPAEYSAIKGGIINFTRYLASYLGPYQITANCISLGGIYDQQPNSFVENYSRNVPLGRMGNTDDFKGAIIFLSSDSSNYINGHNLVIDGGWTSS
ncbi:oxidoreductase [Cytobacillus sp. FSL H8-0458]|uniref:oxidoreductase n=1 Tax=Cytobacillus sp. FSL H8-0458 TaxID=2975346 RepID=UPI0030FCC60D